MNVWKSGLRTMVVSGLMLSVVASLGSTPVQAAATIVVTGSGDAVAVDGACTLREAIEAANSNSSVNECTHNGSAGTDAIVFNIRGTGPHAIRPQSPLPAVTDSVSIDGYTQPGASPNSLVQGNDATLMIELEGSAVAGKYAGLVIDASGSTVRGLVINRFPGNGITVGTSGPPFVANVVIEGNFVGTDVSGTTALGNGSVQGDGIVLAGSSNRIGGATPAARNLISGNRGSGIFLLSAITSTPASLNVIEGNYIGTDRSGMYGLGNGRDGINLLDAFDNRIGGTGSGQANVVAFNEGSGVVVDYDGRGQLPTGNSIRGNNIFENFGLGIDLGGDGVTPNDPQDGWQDYPVITSVVTQVSSGVATTEVSGTTNVGPSGLNLYLNTVCDPSAHGEGRTPLWWDNLTYSCSPGGCSFTAFISATVPGGSYITATATGDDGSTSEFSMCAQKEPAANSLFLPVVSAG